MGTSKRGDPTKRPVERQMSRADSLSSMNEFGSIVPLAKQESLRKSKPKPGPLNRLMNKLTSALGGK